MTLAYKSLLFIYLKTLLNASYLIPYPIEFKRYVRPSRDTNKSILTFGKLVMPVGYGGGGGQIQEGDKSPL